MIHEGQRLEFTRNALFQLVMYYIINKNTKKYDPKRADFIGDMFGDMKDLGDWLKHYEKRLNAGKFKSEKEAQRILKNNVRKYTNEAFDRIAEQYVLTSSQKKNSIDPVTYEYLSKSEGGIPSMFMYYGSINPTENELARLEDYLKKKHVGASEKFIKEKMKEELLGVTKFFQAEFFGNLHSKDVRGFYNYHMELNDGHKNPHGHLHYIVPAFNPVTGHFCNPKRYDLAKQKAHIATEKKFKHWLEQGIAAGLTPEVMQLRKDSIYVIENDLRNTTSVVDKATLRSMAEEVYDESVNRINEVIGQFESTSGMSFEDYKQAFARVGIVVEPGATKIKTQDKKRNRDTEKFLVFTDQKTGAVVTNPHLSSKARTTVKRIGNRYLNDRLMAELHGNKSAMFKYDKIENVLLKTLESVKKDMDIELAKSYNTVFEDDMPEIKLQKEKNIKAIRHNAYKTFFKMALDKGIIVNMTKQNSKGKSNLTYHVISSSFKEGVSFQAESYKASNFVLDLQGKTISEIMALDPEIIQYHQDIIMQYLQTGYQRQKYAFLQNNSIRDRDFNDTVQEYFQSAYHEKLMDKNGWEISYNENNDAYWLVDKNTGAGLVCLVKDPEHEGVFSLIINELNPFEAAKAIIAMDSDEVKKLEDGEFFNYFDNKHGKKVLSRSATFEHLYIERMFTKDVILHDRLSVFVKTERTHEKAMKKLQYVLDASDKKFNQSKTTAIKKGKFNFTDTHGIYLLDVQKSRGQLDRDKDEESFRRMEDEIIVNIKSGVNEKLCEQIAYLVDHDVKQFSMKNQNMDKFIKENRALILTHVKNEENLEALFKEMENEKSTQKQTRKKSSSKKR
ncbi:TPA: hypothetical protein ACN35C_004639 [Vibrio parahaemolyticus]